MIVIINSDYIIYNLTKDDICSISSDLFKFVSFDNWKDDISKVINKLNTSFSIFEFNSFSLFIIHIIYYFFNYM